MYSKNQTINNRVALRVDIFFISSCVVRTNF